MEDRNICATYTRSWECDLYDVHAVCPRCGNYHSVGDFHFRGSYVMGAESYYDNKSSLITPELRGVAPIDPKTYMLSTMAVQVLCYDCNHPMLLYPHHLSDPIAAFNSWGHHVDGCHFSKTGMPFKRKLILMDITELITLLSEQVQNENINFDPDPSVSGIEQYCFDVSATKDQDFSDLRNIVITKNRDDDGGCIQFDHLIEMQLEAKFSKEEDVENTREFLRGIELILELVANYHTVREFKGPEFDTATMYDCKYYGKKIHSISADIKE